MLNRSKMTSRLVQAYSVRTLVRALRLLMSAVGLGGGLRECVSWLRYWRAARVLIRLR
jgi:hypothetical protein